MVNGHAGWMSRGEVGWMDERTVKRNAEKMKKEAEAGMCGWMDGWMKAEEKSRLTLPPLSHSTVCSRWTEMRAQTFSVRVPAARPARPPSKEYPHCSLFTVQARRSATCHCRISVPCRRESETVVRPACGTHWHTIRRLPRLARLEGARRWQRSRRQGACSVFQSQRRTQRQRSERAPLRTDKG